MISRACTSLLVVLALFIATGNSAVRGLQPSESGTWLLTGNSGTIKGFADQTSVADGDTLHLYVSTPAQTFAVEVYRVGWYDDGASQAKLITRVHGLVGGLQPAATLEPGTGLVSAANWTSNAAIDVRGWSTGLYLLKLIADDGDQNYIPVVVRDDVGTHDFLFQHADTTDQAYNGWGGKSLYDFNSIGENTASGRRAAVKVSFDRPLDGNGSGRSLGWELNMVRWLEANGFDVAYASDLDVHRDAQFDNRVRAVLLVGHSEYWSKEMRDHLEAARDHGKGIGLFTGDTGSWSIRLEDSALGANRVQVFYGDSPADPVMQSDPSRATTHWFSPPLNRPTHQFFGVGTNGPLKRSADWTVAGATSAPQLFAGTGLNDGDAVKNLIGYEYDGLWTPGNNGALAPRLQVLGRGIVAPTRPIEWFTTFATRIGIGDAHAPPAEVLHTVVDPGSTWSLYARVRSGTHSWSLQYVPADGSPSRYDSGGSAYARLPIGSAYTDPGWRGLDLDLKSDFASVFGPPPADLRVDSVILRGSLSIGPISVGAASGPRTVLSLAGAKSPRDTGWEIVAGNGDLSIGQGPSGEPTLMMRPRTPEQRVDEAHSVVMYGPSGNLVVAAGTIQWSWALDEYGQHTDAKGNVTPVDPRLQALTRNLLVALRDAR